MRFDAIDGRPNTKGGAYRLEMLPTTCHVYFSEVSLASADDRHMQFNVVTANLLREAKADPASHRDLIVRVAGYSDYFCDLSEALQDEIIRRTEHTAF